MVRLKPSRRPISLVTVVLIALLGIASCAAPMNITDTPGSVDDARALAQAVADKAGCGSLEDYNVNGQPDRWTFTCQMNDANFDITAYGSPKARSEQEAQLRESGWQYWSQDSYTVVAIPKSTSKSASGVISPDLEPFRKALDHSTK